MVRTSEKPAWFSEEVVDISTNSRQLLEDYSSIPTEQVIQYVIANAGHCLPHTNCCKDPAHQSFTPSVKGVRDLPVFVYSPAPLPQLNLSAHPRYAEVLQRLHNGEDFLDADCYLGQDIRKLVADGLHPSQIHSRDLE